MRAPTGLARFTFGLCPTCGALPSGWCIGGPAVHIARWMLTEPEAPGPTAGIRLGAYGLSDCGGPWRAEWM